MNSLVGIFPIYLMLPVFCILFAGCGERTAESPLAAPVKKFIAPFAEKPPPATELYLANGMSEDEVRSVLGEPKGNMSAGNRKMLLYEGGHIELINGRVTNLNPEFIKVFQAVRKEAAKTAVFEERQRAKGLVLFQGEWMKPKERDRLAAQKRNMERAEQRKRQAQEKMYASVMVRDKNGNPVDHSRLVRHGQITVVDFYADWCGPCRKLAPYLEALAGKNRDVILKKVDIGNWGSPTTKKYNIRSVPNVRVFDRKGRLVGPPTSSFSQIRQYVETARHR